MSDPIVLVDVPLLFGLSTKRFEIRGVFKAATFRHRQESALYCVLHRSTKQPGMWQLSMFDADGPFSDIQASEPAAALKFGLQTHERWFVEKVRT